MKILSPSSFIQKNLTDFITEINGTDICLIEAGTKIPNDIDPKKSILIAPEMSADGGINLVESTGVQHLLAADRENFQMELKATKCLIETPIKFMQQPLEYMLKDTAGGGRLFLEFSNATEKQETINRVREFIQTTPSTQSIVDDVMVVADELFTNAIYNAPKHKGQNQIDSLLRINSVSLKQGQSAKITMGHDQQHLILCCEDPFGTLDPHAIIKRIQNCFVRGVSESINMGAGGAGIGTYLVYTLSVGLFLLVNKNVCTQVCCVFPLKKSSRARAAMSKSIHISVFEEA